MVRTLAPYSVLQERRHTSRCRHYEILFQEAFLWRHNQLPECCLSLLVVYSLVFTSEVPLIGGNI